jgi:16S rRNA (adenine1518-N6/adenine1519-N6)-dimethyltransferase
VDPRKLSELDPFLKGSGLSPKKSLSQNFLVDANILKKIVKTARVAPGDSVLEIGPGPGALTITLIEAGANVTAVEIDKNYASKLADTIKSPNLEVICEDFLQFTPTKKSIVVANIPYHISTPIIEKLTETRELFSRIFLTVQKDFAERILTKGKSNAFSIFIDFYYQSAIPFTISKDCFYPKPTIASVLLSLVPREKLALPDPIPFIAFVRLLFQKRRKMIRSILGIPTLTDARPESLKTNDFIQLYLLLQKQNLLPAFRPDF